MVSVFVTGSADGIGRETALTLARAGHRVVLHARSDERGVAARRAVPEAAGVVIGDLSSLAETGALAATATADGPFDVVIHNAGVGGEPERVVTADGISRIFQVNVVAPYLLTALMPRPSRLVYLASGLEARGVVDLADPMYEQKPWDGMQAYSDSKLYDVMLAFAVARRHPEVICNAVDPGWIRTKMGGPDATDDLPEGAETQVWLATSDEPSATASGRYLKRRTSLTANPAAYDVAAQDELLTLLERLTGAALP